MRSRLDLKVRPQAPNSLSYSSQVHQGYFLVANWEFLKSQGKMSSTSAGFYNLLASDNLPISHRFVREGLQNVADSAKIKDGEASAIITEIEIDGEKKRELFDFLEVKENFLDRLSDFQFQPGNAFETADDITKPLKCLVLADYETVGLGGSLKDGARGNHFYRLVMNLGFDDKAEAGSMSGGSFGFGKTTFTKASKIGMVAYYSVFEPDEMTDGHHARFMVTSVFKHHHHEGDHYRGFSFSAGWKRGKHSRWWTRQPMLRRKNLA